MQSDINEFKVNDKRTFIEFMDLLHKDLLENSERWENRTLADFLEAVNRYTEDIQSYYDNVGIHINTEIPNWSTFADIFKGARIYE